MVMVRWLGIVFSLLAAALTSQLPEFAQQYRQRLGGAIDELNRVLSDFDRDAAARDMDRAKALQRMREDADKFVQARGLRIGEYQERFTRLQRQRENFQTAGSLQRIAVMSRDFDSDIAMRAWADFEPAAPLTMEGGVAAGAGFLAGFGLWKLLGWPISRRRRRLAAQRAQGRIEPIVANDQGGRT